MSRLARILRRLVPLVVLAALVVAGGVLLFGGKEALPLYEVELDNAFGLVEGADVRMAGVNAGKVSTLKVDPRTARAIVAVEIARDDFGDLRKDATCSIEPQSLIGEYYLDCQPGTDRKRIPEGGRIPVEQTTGTIPPDLVASIMQRPQREQLGFIRPYAPDLVGWFDDFSTSGMYDALGSFSRAGLELNGFTLDSALNLLLVPPELRRTLLSSGGLVTGRNNRCPGSMERPAADGSNPWKPTEDFNCDPRQIPPGR